MKIGKGKNKRFVYEPYKGFGKQKAVEKLSSNQDIFESLLKGENILFCARMQDETGSGGDIMSLLEISKLGDDDKFRLFYDMVIQNEVIKLGIRRQHEQGRGFLNVMDAEYRRLIGLNDAAYNDHIIFNWYTIAELKQIPRNSGLFVNTNALKSLVLALSTNCDAAHEFPCLFNGIPFDEEGGKRCHLLFMVKSSSESNLKINMRVNEKFI